MILKRKKRYLQLSLRYDSDLFRKVCNGNPNYRKSKILNQEFFYTIKNPKLRYLWNKGPMRASVRYSIVPRTKFAYNISANTPPRRRRQRGFSRDLFVAFQRIRYFYFNIKRHQWRLYAKRKAYNRMFRYKYNVDMRSYFKNYQVNANFLSLIERRLDVILFRSNFAISMSHARQLVQHKHVLVNNITVFSCNFIVKNFDIICLKKPMELKIRRLLISRLGRDKFMLYPPVYLSVDYSMMCSLVNKNAEMDEIPFPFKISSDIIRGLARYD